MPYICNAKSHGLGFYIIGRFDDHPKWPGLRSHTACIVRKDGQFVETKHSAFRLIGGWDESPELLLRWRELSREAVHTLCKAKYKLAYRQRKKQEVPPMFAPGGPLYVPD